MIYDTVFFFQYYKIFIKDVHASSVRVEATGQMLWTILSYVEDASLIFTVQYDDQ